MPGSFIGELILQPILEFFLHVVCYYIGWVVVPVLSLGRLKCDPITADTRQRKQTAGGSFHRRGQQVYLTPETTALVGLLVVALIVTGVFLDYYS